MKIKPSHNAIRSYLFKELPLSLPFVVNLDVSEVCNLKCNYCFRAKNYKTYGFTLRNDLMSIETFKISVEQLKKFKEPIKKVSLSGHGEPLCNRKLPEMIRYLKSELDTFVEIHTNGVLLDEKYAIELAESKINKIVISVQGLTSDKYKEVCGKTVNFGKFIKNIETLYKFSTDTEVYVKIVDVALNQGAEELFYDMFRNKCHSAYIEKAIDLWTDLDNKSNNIINQNKFGELIPYQESCSSCFYTLFVVPNGEVHPCIQPLSPICFGNVHEGDLVSMWKSSKRQQFLKNQLVNGRKSIKVCDTCAVAQNTIMSQEHDSLNGWQNDILDRLNY